MKKNLSMLAMNWVYILLKYNIKVLRIMKKIIENIRYSKRFILSFIFVLFVTFSFGQIPNGRFIPRFDLTKYEVVDSLPIEHIMIHFDKEIDDENFISLGDGDYMAPVPHKDNMIIKATSDKSKAIVIHNSYAFGRHFEFNVEDNERRTILWYEDKGIYCGYIYDKTYKVCKYFESRKEFRRFMRRPFFNRNLNN